MTVAFVAWVSLLVGFIVGAVLAMVDEARARAAAGLAPTVAPPPPAVHTLTVRVEVCPDGDGHRRVEVSCAPCSLMGRSCLPRALEGDWTRLVARALSSEFASRRAGVVHVLPEGERYEPLTGRLPS